MDKYHLKSILVPGAVGAGVGGVLGGAYSDDGYRGHGRWEEPKKFTVKDRLRHAGVGALIGGTYGGLMGHTGFRLAESLNPPPSGPKPKTKKPALDIARKRWKGQAGIMKGEKVAMMAAFCDELEKIAAAQKEAAPQWMQEGIESGLRKLKVPQAIGKVTEHALADVPGTPRLLMRHRSLPERQMLGQQAGEKVVGQLSQHPDTALITALVPGGTLLGPMYHQAKQRIFR